MLPRLETATLRYYCEHLIPPRARRKLWTFRCLDCRHRPHVYDRVESNAEGFTLLDEVDRRLSGIVRG